LIIQELDLLYSLVSNLKGIVDHNSSHLEEDVYSHSIQVFALAVQDSRDVDLVLAALLHDIGKAHGSPDHAQTAVSMLKPFTLIKPKTLWLIENHSRIMFLQLGQMKKISKIRALTENPYYSDLLQLREYDINGRKASPNISWDKESIKQALYNLLNQV
jgi:predicted HD phosphohydrolase